MQGKADDDVVVKCIRKTHWFCECCSTKTYLTKNVANLFSNTILNDYYVTSEYELFKKIKYDSN